MPPHRPPPTTGSVTYDGKRYSLYLEIYGWRLRKRSKTAPIDFRTGTKNLREAEQKAKEWLELRGESPLVSRKGGGTLEAVAAVYLASLKRAAENVAKDNVSRLRALCRAVVDKELADIPCKQISPEFWQRYQRAIIEGAGYKFDLNSRRRENIGVNAAVRAARSLFQPAMIRAYRATGLEVRTDAGQSEMLPEPYVPPAKVDDAGLLKAWAELEGTNKALWLAIGIARFTGLRMQEIAHCRVGWIEERKGSMFIYMRDRQEEQWKTKTGKPYRAQVIDPKIADYLRALVATADEDAFVVPDPSDGGSRKRWFGRVPQAWIRQFSATARLPLHRMRGLYADHLAELTADAVAARQAGIKAAQENLGHTSPAMTEKHYLNPET